MRPTVVFMGSPEFAVPVLQALAAKYPLVGVVTQPDRPAGRGRMPTPPPVKRHALDLGLAVIQPRSLRTPEARDTLAGWAPDLVVVAAFGQILRPDVLDLPRFGCINVHASLLPRWRGAAPIQAAILAGDPQAGVTIMRMDPGIDTGPILRSRSIDIAADDTAKSLSGKLSALGAGLLLETLPGYLDGTITPQPQPDDGVAYAPMLKKDDGLLDFERTGEDLERRVRAYYPWPGAFLDWPGGRIKVLRARVVRGEDGLPPGTRLIRNGLPAMRAADSLLLLEQVQPAGKLPMAGKVFLNGARGWV